MACNPNLAAKADSQFPDQRPFTCFRRVDLVRAFFAGAFAAPAIVRAPAKVPFGAGDQPFFSVTNTIAFATKAAKEL